MLLVIFMGIASCSKLYITRIDTDVAQGRYTSSDHGIVFNSSSRSINIFDLLGNEILRVQIISSSQQLVVIQGKVFIQTYISETQSYHDYYLLQHLLNDDKEHFLGHVNEVTLKLISTQGYQYHSEQLRKSVKELANSFSNIINEVAYSLGNNFNICGKIYPSILPFYLVATMLGKVYGNKEMPYTHRNTHTFKNEDNCFDECPPCPEEECLSLCGYGCHCWKWVCGDCCYHLGCFGHDVCCRKNFYQTKCLFPISFQCDSEYYC